MSTNVIIDIENPEVLKVEYKKVKQKYDELVENFNDLQIKYSLLQKENNDQQEQIENLDKKVKQSKILLHQTPQFLEFQKFSQRIDEEAEEKQATIAEIKTLKNNINLLTEHIQKLESQVEVLKQEKQDLNNQNNKHLEEVKNENKKSEENLENKFKQFQELMENKYQNDKKGLEERVSELELKDYYIYRYQAVKRIKQECSKAICGNAEQNVSNLYQQPEFKTQIDDFFKKYELSYKDIQNVKTSVDVRNIYGHPTYYQMANNKKYFLEDKLQNDVQQKDILLKLYNFVCEENQNEQERKQSISNEENLKAESSQPYQHSKSYQNKSKQAHTVYFKKSEIGLEEKIPKQ